MIHSGCAETGTDSAQPGHGHARLPRLGSTAGGGWTSHIPSPGGATEGGRGC
jgi:hypothetical protein